MEDIDEAIDDDSSPDDFRSIIAALNAKADSEDIPLARESTTPKRLLMSPGMYLALLRRGLRL